MIGNEGVVAEIDMLAANAVDLLHLSRAQPLSRIEAPDSFEQSLPPENLVATGDTAMEIIGGVEKRAVAIRDTGVERQQIRRYGVLVARRSAALELFDCACGPDRPVPK